MHRRNFLITGTAGMLAACAPAPRINPLSRATARSLTLADVTVDTSGAAFENARARDRSSTLAPDLRAALRQEFSDRLNPAGAVMRVDVTRLNVASSASSAFGSDQSALQGAVRIEEPGTGRTLAAYAIDVRAGQAAESRAGALISSVTRSSGGFYRTLLDAFTKQTRQRVLE